MRARNLKPGLFKNAELADAGPIAQLLFAGLWLLADKEGRLKDQPRVIKAEIFPYYDADVNGELTVLQRLGHVRRYVNAGIAVIEVLNFKKHQSPHHTEKASELPAYDPVSGCNQTTQVNHREVTVKSPLDDGEYPSDSLIPDSLIPDSSTQEHKPRAAVPVAMKPTPEGEMAVALRDKGVTVTSQSPILLAWIRDGFSTQQTLEATELARMRKPWPEKIPPAYLDTILRQPQRLSVVSSSKPIKYRTVEEIEAEELARETANAQH